MPDWLEDPRRTRERWSGLAVQVQQRHLAESIVAPDDLAREPLIAGPGAKLLFCRRRAYLALTHFIERRTGWYTGITGQVPHPR